MNFSKTYRRMNEPVGPSPDLIRKTLSHPDRHRLPLRRLAAAAAAAAVLLATPALAVRSETGYAVLYRIAPAVAQFFQPIQEACTDSGITMEVAAVRVEGDTAQAYIVLSGGPVDATTDLFDSWSFHLPFDQTGRCERVAWDEATGTVTFLCTVKTMDGSPIPTGGKMTFSVRQLLTGKKAMEGVTVDLKLTNYAQEAETGGFGVLDEINMAKNESLAVLHATLDFRRSIDMPGYERIPLHDATRFIATMNYGYAGTRELNEALASRFVVIDMPAITTEGLIKLLKREFPSLKGVYAEQFAGLFQDIQKKCDGGELSTKPLDLRGLLAAVRLMRTGLEGNRALDLGLVNKSFDDFERQLVRDVIRTRLPETLRREDVFD